MDRRSLLRKAAATGGAIAALGVRAAGAAAAPVSTNRPVVLWWLADTSLPQTSVGYGILNEATAPFTAKHRGVVLKPGFMQGNSIIPTMISGNGPDIIADWDASPYWAGDLLLPLDSYLRRDNIDTSVWSAGQWAVMAQPFGTYMLPAYFSPMVYFVRLSDFDELGLAYPNPDWTYTEYTDIARKLTIHTAKRTRYGTDVEFHHTRISGESWLFKAFGGNLMNADGTRQTLSDPGSVAGGRWVFEDLFWSGIGCYRDQFWGQTGLDGLIQDQQSMRVTWGNGMLINAAQAIRDQFKWAIYPAPVFPKGRMTQGTEDFYAINAQTKNPELAWEFLKYLSYEPTFTRYLMSVDAQTPSLIHLWPEWQRIVENVAPPLRGKGLQWYADAALKGYGLPGEYFRYQDAQVRAIDGPWIFKLWNKQTDVETAFRAADAQVNAFLGQAAATAAAQAQLGAVLAHAEASAADVVFAAPPKAGTGQPASALPAAWASAAQGVYHLSGAGQGVQGGGDNASFFCAASEDSRAEFTCRVTAIVNVDTPAIPNGAKIGLMARGSLANDDAMVGVSVNIGRGVHFFGRALPGSAYGDQHSGSAPGLLPAAQILQAAATSSKGNNLLKPVWLRLVRRANTWQAFTSLDGSTWLPAGTPIGAQMAGVWVGLFVTAHDGALGKSGLRIQAAFDHVSGFVPSAAYQLGSA